MILKEPSCILNILKWYRETLPIMTMSYTITQRAGRGINNMKDPGLIVGAGRGRRSVCCYGTLGPGHFVSYRSGFA